MPRRWSAAKRRHGRWIKRAYRKKRRMVRRRRYPRYRRPKGGFPKTLMAKLVYSETFNLDAGIAAIDTKAFYANGPGAPTVGAGGGAHRPCNWTVFESLYDTYTCVGSKITLRWNPISSNTPEDPNPILGVSTQHTTTEVANAYTAGSHNAINEMPRTSLSRNIIGAPEGRRSVLQQKFSAKKLFGLKSVVGQKEYIADTSSGATPDENYFFICFAMSPDASVNPAEVNVQIHITYIVVFTEPKTCVFSALA